MLHQIFFLVVFVLDDSDGPPARLYLDLSAVHQSPVIPSPSASRQVFNNFRIYMFNLDRQDIILFSKLTNGSGVCKSIINMG